MTASTFSEGSFGSLEARMRERLHEIFGSTLHDMVVNSVAHELAVTAAAWLQERSREEVFDSQGEYALRRAADAAWLHV